MTAPTDIVNWNPVDGSPGPPDWSQGPPGATGATGAPGSPGAKGDKGDPGIQGVQGVAGVGLPGATGATGPQGNTGATGATGAASTVPGPAGAQGAPGATMLYRGAWSSGTTYLFLDTVSYNGSSYVATTTVPAGQANPSINASWAVMAQAGASGAPGSQWYTGAGAPAGATGVVGDWYLNSTTGDYYSKTGASTWTLQGNLKGPQGIQGIQGVTGTVAAAGPGSALLPSISFAGDPDTGMYNAGVNFLGFSTAGVQRWMIDPFGFLYAGTDNAYDIGGSSTFRPRNIYTGTSMYTGVGSPTAPSISFAGDPDTGLYNPAANTVWLTGGGVPRFMAGAYGTDPQMNFITAYTDIANYESLWFVSLSNTTYMITSSAGTGAVRPFVLGTNGAASLTLRTSGINRWTIDNSGNFTASTDSVLDIGASGANRPRNLYVGSNVASPTIYNPSGDLSVSASAQIVFSPGYNQRWLFTTPGHFQPSADNTVDIGYPAGRPRTIYAGTSVVTPLVSVGDGTALLPSITFGSETNTGFFKATVGQLGLTTQGVERFRFWGDAAFSYIESDPGRSIDIIFKTANTRRWRVHAGGNFIPDVDNTYDIGYAAGSFRPRNLYLAGTATVASLIVQSPAAFAAGDRYLVVDASGNVHKSAIGPAS